MNPERLERLLETVLAEHGRALRLFAATWCQSPDDCLQHGLIKLAEQDSVPKDIIAWLYRVVRNEAIAQSRSEQRRKRRETMVVQSRPLFSSEKANTVDEGEVEKSLQSLPIELREVVVAKIWSDLTFEQIGEIAGCSASAVHRRFNKGIALLRNSLQETWYQTK